MSCSPMQDFDIWWHLRTGQLILERQAIPWGDWYTYTENTAAWIDLHWGFQLLVTALHSLGGVRLLVLATAALTTVAVAIGWSVTGDRLPVWLKSIVWGLAAVCITGRALPRPELLSLVFLATWLWISERLPKQPSLLWWLPAVQVLWINCHALFVLGLVVAAAYGVDAVVRTLAASRWGLPPADDAPAPKMAFRAGLLLLVAALINPYLEQGALFPFELFRKLAVDHEFYAARIDEFTPPLAFFRQVGLRSLHFDAGLLLWLITAGSFIVAVSRKQVSVYRWLLFGAFSLLAWKMLRNANFMALTAAVLLCGNLQDLWDKQLIGGKRDSGGPRPNDGTPIGAAPAQPKWASPAIAVVMVALAAAHLTGHWGQWTGLGDRFGLGEADAWYAHGAAQFVAQNDLPRRAVVAHIGQAGVFIYHNAPKRLVFMDGRLEVCTRRTFEMFEDIQRRMAAADSSWVELAGSRDEQGQLPTVILDSRLSRPQINGLLATPGWRMVFADQAAAVFIEDKLADHLQLPSANPEPLLAPPGTVRRHSR